jgi:hypothetical protein
VFLLVAKLVAMQRAEIIAELSDRVAHRDPEDASAAVRQLGEMPQPPATVLVEAATGADRKVANEARQTISKLLRRAQQRLEAGRGVKAISRQLTDLARELADHRHAFPAADQTWLVSTAQRILHLANQVPPKHSPTVAANCDLILTSIPTAAAVVAEPAGPPDSQKQSQNAPNSEQAIATESTTAITPAEDGEPARTEGNDSIFAPWRVDSSQPVFRPLPSQTDGTPLHPSVSPTPPPDAAPPALPADVELIGRPIANVDLRDVMQKWLDTNGNGLTSQEKELLKQRGFDRLPIQLVRKLFSSPQDRLQLVDDVLQEPGINARPWLILLSGDSDADVRLAAVTVMATSTDTVLVEQAWQAAIHDRDPRVAALATRLKERRAAIQRR